MFRKKGFFKFEKPRQQKNEVFSILQENSHVVLISYTKYPNTRFDSKIFL